MMYLAGLGVDAGISTDLDLGNGQTVPGTAVASAAYKFAKDPSAESATNAAMSVMCNVAAGGSPASHVCGFLTVGNILQFGDFLVNKVLKNVGVPVAQGVLECWFYFPDLNREAYLSFVGATTALNKAWYATRKAMGLPHKLNPDAINGYRYKPRKVCKGGYCRSGGEDGGFECWEGECTSKMGALSTQEKPVVFGYRSRRVEQILARDKNWNSSPSIVVGSGSLARKVYLPAPPAPPFVLAWEGSNPHTNCAGNVAEWNTAGSGLLTKYRLEPVKKAVQQVLREWGKQLDLEYAQRVEKRAVDRSQAARVKQTGTAITSYVQSIGKAKGDRRLLWVLALAGLAAGTVYAVRTAR